MKRWSAAAKAAAVAVVLAAGAALWLAFWPGLYQGIEVTAILVAPGDAGPPPPNTQVQRQLSASLLEVNGLQALFPILLPVALTGLGLLTVLWRDAPGSRIALWCSAVVLAAFTTLALFSVGLFIAPSALALVTAAALHQREKAGPSARPGQRRPNSPI